MITILNKQKKYSISAAFLKKSCRLIMQELSVDHFDLTIVLCGKTKIQNLNKAFRKKDYVADILSFPAFENLTPGIVPQKTKFECELGELVICPEQVAQDAKKLKQLLLARLKKLLVHGVCHLLGYTHYTEEEHAVMLPIEEQILNKLG